MPILQPLDSTLLGGITIGELATIEVIPKCENRVSDVVRAYGWVRDALIELSSDPQHRGEFDELELAGPTFNLTPRKQEYSFSGNFVAPGDYALAGLDILLWNDPPTNVQRRKLRWTHYQHADMMVGGISFSLPQMWYRFGDNIGFVPIPDKAYQVQSRLYLMHNILADLKSTVVQLPRDWYEIIVMSALERGWIELEEYEKSSAIHQLIYGDPARPNRPGMITNLKKRREREAWRHEGAMRPVVATYSQKGRR